MQCTATNHVGAPTSCLCTVDLTKKEDVGGQWSKPDLAVDWLGKIPPIDLPQQLRLNYKRRVYSAHMKGAPQVHSLGDRGGCVIGPYRTPTILGYATKTGSHSSST